MRLWFATLNLEVTYLITMKFIGNLKFPPGMFLLILLQMGSLSATADIKENSDLDTEWDSDFFHHNCPGMPLEKSTEV